mgnify:CR=1 FL=1
MNIVPTASTDGLVYASAVPLTPSEADLFGGTGANSLDPFPTLYTEAILTIVQLSINGIIVANSTYIVMQQDMGDGVWVDMNWLFWNGTQGTATFVFSNGVAGANTFQQSRNAGSVPNPQANGSNQVALGGRMRFVGQTKMTSGSSSAPGVTTQVTVTIKYRLQPLR